MTPLLARRRFVALAALVSAPQAIARHLPSIAYKTVQKALQAADRDGVTAAGERSVRCLAALDS